MADLLECLIQIKGVADTPRRLERLALGDFAGEPPRLPSASGAGRASRWSSAGRPSAAEVARGLAAMETWFQQCLSAMLEVDRPALPEMPAHPSNDETTATEEWLARFGAQRATTVARLDACSAEQLNRVGMDPSRGPMTVADLVAVMLAHDTDALGALVAR